MKTYIQWFFILGAALFLSWYVPAAMKDGGLTIAELATIIVNVACVVINLVGYVESTER